jgi:hypothetical protein
MKIIEIKAFFEGFEFPNENIRISEGEVLTDVSKMVDSHIEILTENSGNRVFLPYYERLMFVINYIKNNKQINQ